MPTYRVYYIEREPKNARSSDEVPADPRFRALTGREYYSEPEWEEEIEAPDAARALDEFFREHIRDNSELMWVDASGETRSVEGIHYDPARTYIWVEEGKLMEFQGLDEATPGKVTCPLCGGEGEVDEDLAAKFDEVWGFDEGEIEADIQG